MTGARSSCKRRRERSNRDCNFSRTIKECYSAYNVYVRHDARGKPRGIESVTARQSAYTASRTSPPRDSQLESGAAQDGRRRTGSSIGCPLPLRYTHAGSVIETGILITMCRANATLFVRRIKNLPISDSVQILFKSRNFPTWFLDRIGFSGNFFFNESTKYDSYNFVHFMRN